MEQLEIQKLIGSLTFETEMRKREIDGVSSRLLVDEKYKNQLEQLGLLTFKTEAVKRKQTSKQSFRKSIKQIK